MASAPWGQERVAKGAIPCSPGGANSLRIPGFSFRGFKKRVSPTVRGGERWGSGRERTCIGPLLGCEPRRLLTRRLALPCSVTVRIRSRFPIVNRRRQSARVRRNTGSGGRNRMAGTDTSDTDTSDTDTSDTNTSETDRANDSRARGAEHSDTRCGRNLVYGRNLCRGRNLVYGRNLGRGERRARPRATHGCYRQRPDGFGKRPGPLPPCSGHSASNRQPTRPMQQRFVSCLSPSIDIGVPDCATTRVIVFCWV